MMNEIVKKTDEEVIESVRSRDKELFAEIIRRYQDKLIRYAQYLTNDEYAVNDIVQESFIKAYVNLNGFDVKKKFSSWMYRIVHNEAMNAIGKQKKTQPADDALEIDSGIDLEDELIRAELRQHAHACLEKMPIMYKEPLSLYFLEDKSYEEISDILRLPTKTVATRINRAKKIMKKLCQTHMK